MAVETGVLACPVCRGALAAEDNKLGCASCGRRFLADPVPDLRVPEPFEVQETILVQPVWTEARPPASPISARTGGPRFDREDFADGLDYGNGMTPELMSWLPDGPGRILDLGCGRRRCESVLSSTGLTYTAIEIDVDVHGVAPDVAGQGERLPFQDETFDAVFALAVLGHTLNPFMAAREVARVLRPGGTFIGTTQFLEPCFMASRHHVTRLGVDDWLRHSRLEVTALEANNGWTGARALIELGYLPGVKMRVKRAVVQQLDRLHRAQEIRRADIEPPPPGEVGAEKLTSGFRFVARKPAPSESPASRRAH